MKILSWAKDGGKHSPVDAFFLFESKTFGSAAILRFNKGRREAFHTHAFNAYTWFIFGDLVEEDVSGLRFKYKKSFKPKLTLKSKNHRVLANKTSWCFTLRGPWSKTWTEFEDGKTTTFGWGRKILSKEAKSP